MSDAALDPRERTCSRPFSFRICCQNRICYFENILIRINRRIIEHLGTHKLAGRLVGICVTDFDRNIGNILIDPAWKIWLIDHTRSFTIHRHLYRPDRIHLCERGMWRRLRALDESTVQEHLGDELDSKKIAALIRRRELLIAYLEGLIAERGEAIVLFDLDPAQ